MHPVLDVAASALAIDLSNLAEAAARTDQRLSVVRAEARQYLELAGLGTAHQFDIVAFGSIARQEMSPGSDFDWLVIARRFSEDPDDFVHYRRAAVSAMEALGLEPPGASGLFGTVIGGTELVNTIGLDNDTNLHHSRRILVLEESVSLLEPDRHRELRKAITARYLHDQVNQPGKAPRFLLNDVVRYWRTVAVDYQAKRWQELEGRKWGLRLLKLRSSRKLTFAGTLASLLTPAIANTTTNVNGLVDAWEMPPLARLAAWHEFVTGDARRALADVLVLADQFMGWLATEDIRRAAEQVAHPREAAVGSQLHDVYEATHALQDALLRLFSSSEPVNGNPEASIGEIASRYLLF